MSQYVWPKSFSHGLYSIQKYAAEVWLLALPFSYYYMLLPCLHTDIPSNKSQNRLPKGCLERIYSTKTPSCLAVSRFAHHRRQSTTCRQGNHRSRSNVDDVRSAKSRVASSRGAEQRVVRIHLTCRDSVICFYQFETLWDLRRNLS